MTKVFHELYRVLQPGGHIAFEVGEVRGGKIKLEETVLSCGHAAGLEPVLVLINDQRFPPHRDHRKRNPRWQN